MTVQSIQYCALLRGCQLLQNRINVVKKNKKNTVYVNNS